MKYENGTHGKAYWRSLNELAESDEYQEFLHREFPEGASELSDSMSRRKFLTLMGASMALAGLASCRKPVQKIIPYVHQPEAMTLGQPEFYATTMPFQNSAYGLLVESDEGRPTKIEGNAEHPSSLGKANVFQQASTLNLYDPDRSDAVLQNGAEKQYSDFVNFWRGVFTQHLNNKGAGLAVVSGAFSSPTLSRLQQKFLKQFPNADWVVYEPVSDENLYEGVRIATGDYYQPVYHYNQANVVLSLEADFALYEHENITSARGFMDGRRVQSTKDGMNRLYAVESMYTLTGAMADHRMKLQSRRIGSFVLALAEELSSQGLTISGMNGVNAGTHNFNNKWIHELATDLLNNRNRSLLVAGRNQPPVVHAMIYAINAALGNVGRTLEYRAIDPNTIPNLSAFKRLVGEMHDNKVDTVVMIGGNPVYNAPADLDFAGALKQVKHSVHLSSHVDETSEQTEWHIPEAHFLESWGDTRSVNGTKSVIQPLIAPMFNGQSHVEFYEMIATGQEQQGYDIIRETWADYLPSTNFEKHWRKVVHDGVYTKDAPRLGSPGPDNAAIDRAVKSYAPPAEVTSASNLEVVFQVSASVFDGRWANNGWLQELPDPITKLTWDNALVMNPKTAKELGLKNEHFARVSYNGKQLDIPVWTVPGFADYTVALELGFGRKSAGRVGNGTGFDVYPLRTSDAMNFGAGMTVKPLEKKYVFACTQDHWSLEGRPVFREGTLEEYREDPEFTSELGTEHPPAKNLWHEFSYAEGYQWGMAVDLNVCTGCNACTIACQSENNIPVVGKEMVNKGREMHWIRMDRYFSGDVEDPDMVVQPVPCMHCENAPCETVCPVNATMHDSEGLNVQVYNRCIGTRYCSNNCPYKVRRFNFFNYTGDTPEVEKMGKNPDVTVRPRGVMEKCTYCLQRIKRSEIKAKREDRKLHTDEVVSACQQTCPTDAIVFGDINDPESRVSKIKKQNRNYRMLEWLNTQPRTSYQARLRNPNPALEHVAMFTS